MDLPSTFQDDGHFSPRSGEKSELQYSLHILIFSDMLGFKVEIPKREGNLKDKTRPIYLDMQVRSSISKPYIS